MGKSKWDPHALWTAAKKGDLESLRELLKKPGVDIGATDVEGCTALYFSAREGHLDCVQELLKAGAFIDPVRRHDPDLDERIHPGSDNLMEAKEKIARLLSGHPTTGVQDFESLFAELKKGIPRAADKIESEGFPNGAGSFFTPLMMAIYNGHHEVWNFLLGKGASLGNPTIFRNETPLHVAVRCNNATAVRDLLSAGADPNCTPSPGVCSPRDLAIELGHSKILELFEDKYPSEEGRLPAQLLSACSREILDEVVHLVEKCGATFNECTDDQRSPALVAVGLKHEAIFDFMITSGTTVTDQMVLNAILVARSPERALKLLRSSNEKSYRISRLKEARTFANERGMKEVGVEIGAVVRSYKDKS